MYAWDDRESFGLMVHAWLNGSRLWCGERRGRKVVGERCHCDIKINNNNKIIKKFYIMMIKINNINNRN